MNSLHKTIIFAAFSLASLFAILVFRETPRARLWKGYSLVYARSEKLSEDDILSILVKNGCSGTVSRVNQKIPVYSKLSPVQTQKSGSYILRRNAFFTDSGSSFFVFYVPDSETGALSKAIDELSGYTDTFVSADGAAVFPWAGPLLCLAFFLLLLFKSRKRLFFALSALPLAVLCFSRPFYTLSAASCLALLADFILMRLYGRNILKAGARNLFYIAILVLLPFLALFLSSSANALLFAAAFASGWSLLLLIENLRNLYYQHRNIHIFSFVFIKKPSMIGILGRSNFRLLLVLTGAVVLILICSLFLTRASSGNARGERPLLPGPASAQAEETLPDLQDFMDWSYQTISFPYRKLGTYHHEDSGMAESGSSVSIPEYSVENGRIVERQTEVLSYNSSFISSIYDTIEKAEYPSLEKMMIRQGRNSHYAYTAASGSSAEKSAPLVLAFLAAVPSVLCLYCMAGKVKKWL